MIGVVALTEIGWSASMPLKLKPIDAAGFTSKLDL
jgi:hypothetical protein